MIFEEKHSRQNYFTTLNYEDMHSIPHCQTSMEILFVLSGTVQALRQNQKFTVSAGQCIWVMPYEVHAYTTLTPNNVTVFIFSPDMMPDFEQTVHRQALTCPILSFSPEMESVLSENNHDLFSKKSVLYFLASSVLKGGVSQRKIETDMEPMVQMILFIQEHYREPITLHDLAKHMGYSYNYTSHLFRQYFSEGFCQIVNQHRLDEAVHLMTSHETNMTRVAQECGFSTIRSFNMAFQKRFHMPPTTYYRLSLRKIESI